MQNLTLYIISFKELYHRTSVKENSYALLECIRYSCIYRVLLGLNLNGSFVLQCCKCTTVIEICSSISKNYVSCCTNASSWHPQWVTSCCGNLLYRLDFSHTRLGNTRPTWRMWTEPQQFHHCHRLYIRHHEPNVRIYLVIQHILSSTMYCS